ncbi:unnamed protein product [Darwinula stevensoni]|uniref:Gustatory receptor n=1 Tax=Darwinula stevensoni TaxID=69355 RepID=A0A7R8XGR6_9CRUS|nr:unnamed protein product [Darwinula stevensoni]CAG0892793.1 unnamed protein product [Darwinula stevensoni]
MQEYRKRRRAIKENQHEDSLLLGLCKPCLLMGRILGFLPLRLHGDLSIRPVYILTSLLSFVSYALWSYVFYLHSPFNKASEELGGDLVLAGVSGLVTGVVVLALFSPTILLFKLSIFRNLIRDSQSQIQLACLNGVKRDVHLFMFSFLLFFVACVSFTICLIAIAYFNGMFILFDGNGILVLIFCKVFFMAVTLSEECVFCTIVFCIGRVFSGLNEKSKEMLSKNAGTKPEKDLIGKMRRTHGSLCKMSHTVSNLYGSFLLLKCFFTFFNLIIMIYTVQACLTKQKGLWILITIAPCLILYALELVISTAVCTYAKEKAGALSIPNE